MFTLPMIPPRDDSILWSTSNLHRPLNPPPHTPSQRRYPHHPNQNASRHPTHATFLSTLADDENLILTRKNNIRRFGAGWIRPPGIAKTYQATMDEEKEREEQEHIARREAALAEMERVAEEQERAREMRERGEVDEGRDLDEDVPEAEADDDASPLGSDVESTDDEEEQEGDENEETVEEGEEGEEVDGTGMDGDLDDDVPEAGEEDSSVVSGEGDEDTQEGDMTFNEESFIEGSMLQEADVEQMLDMEDNAAMMGQGMSQPGERDLDNEVPEAEEDVSQGFEHTPTDFEDESSVPFEQSFQERRPVPNELRTNELRTRIFREAEIARQMARQQSMRNSTQESELMNMSGASSSFLGDSPVYGRGADVFRRSIGSVPDLQSAGFRGPPRRFARGDRDAEG